MLALCCSLVAVRKDELRSKVKSKKMSTRPTEVSRTMLLNPQLAPWAVQYAQQLRRYQMGAGLHARFL